MPTRGDIHPVTGRIFLGYQKSCANGERWVTPEAWSYRKAWTSAHAKTPAVRERTKVLRNTDQGRKQRNTYGRVWRKTPKAMVNAAAYQRDRRKSDPLYAITGRITARFYEALRAAGFKNTHPLAEVVGCSSARLKTHFEEWFLPGMTWENRNLWEVDHTIPLALGKTEREISLLSHFTNLQPLWSRDNRKKRSKVSYTYEYSPHERN